MPQRSKRTSRQCRLADASRGRCHATHTHCRSRRAAIAYQRHRLKLGLAAEHSSSHRRPADASSHMKNVSGEPGMGQSTYAVFAAQRHRLGICHPYLNLEDAGQWTATGFHHAANAPAKRHCGTSDPQLDGRGAQRQRVETLQFALREIDDWCSIYNYCRPHRPMVINGDVGIFYAIPSDRIARFNGYSLPWTQDAITHGFGKGAHTY